MNEGKHSALFLSCFYPPKQFSGCFEVPACWVWIGFPAKFSFATGYFPLLEPQLLQYQAGRKINYAIETHLANSGAYHHF